MRTVIILLTGVAVLSAFAMLSGDTVNAVMPGWQVVIYPKYIVFPAGFVLNMLLPLLFLRVFRTGTPRTMAIMYMVIANALFLLLLRPAGLFTGPGMPVSAATARFYQGKMYALPALLLLWIAFYAYATVVLVKRSLISGAGKHKLP
ncbi:MAG: hypothetical protein INR69_10650 [Mucilaginibacter polytrichastri]|nr:hypothetical protein [Mucilaginibacter polytrichastri]